MYRGPVSPPMRIGTDSQFLTTLWIAYCLTSGEQYVYLSQLMQYSGYCACYQDIIDRGFLNLVFCLVLCLVVFNGLYLDSLNNIDRSSSSLLTPPYAKQLKNIKQTH
jgi:hypothetical protein